MNTRSNISGHQNIVIQGVTDSSITLNVNGETREIRNELAALKLLLEKQQAKSFVNDQFVYNIAEMTEANFGFVTGKKAFNEHLTKQLITALELYSKPAERFLAKATKVAPDWESQARISDTAKDIIAYSFVGVLGIQMRKLMAIGKEDLSETKQRKYISNCLITTKRALQLLCFSLLSELWNYKDQRPGDLSREETDCLTAFFEDEFEMDIRGLLRLLQTLQGIFVRQQLAFPLSELSTFGKYLEEGSNFLTACHELQAINELLDKAKFTLLDCFEAEKHLTTVLVTLVFLANYRMVSIKNITYSEIRNKAPRYLHNYTALGIDSKFNVNSERVNYVEEPINTDAILLFKGKYLQSINLFPFIIDLNALTFENGSKICFYSCKDISDGSLNYRFLEDNSIENIVFSDILKEDSNINELMMDLKKRKNIKLDSVFVQFQEAKKAILGVGELQSFDNIFEGEDDF